MTGHEEIRVPGQPEPINHYTEAVRAGDLLFVSGCVVEPSALAIPGAKLEVEAVALIP